MTALVRLLGISGKRFEKPPLDEELADHLAIIGIDAGDEARLIVLQRLQRRQVLRKVPEHPGRSAAPQHEGQQQPIKAICHQRQRRRGFSGLSSK